MFSRFLPFLRPKIEKLAFNFIFMKGLKSKNKMLNFYFGSQKCQKTDENIFFNQYKFIEYNEVWFSRSTFYRRIQKSKNIERITSHSVTIWRNVNVASFFAPDNGNYL